MTFYGWTFLGIVIVLGEWQLLVWWGKKSEREGYEQGYRDANKSWCGWEEQIEEELRREKEMRG